MIKSFASSTIIIDATTGAHTFIKRKTIHIYKSTNKMDKCSPETAIKKIKTRNL
jgi:hypothetical protein